MSALSPKKHSGARRGHICLSNISLTGRNRNLLSRIIVSPKPVQVHCYAVASRPITDSRGKTLSAAFHSLQHAHVHLSTHMPTRCVCPTSSVPTLRVGEREGESARVRSYNKKLEVMFTRVQTQVREPHSWIRTDIIFTRL